MVTDREWKAKGQKEFSVAMNGLRSPGQAVRRCPLKQEAQNTPLQLGSWNYSSLKWLLLLLFCITRNHKSPTIVYSCLVVTCFCFPSEIQNIRSSQSAYWNCLNSKMRSSSQDKDIHDSFAQVLFQWACVLYIQTSINWAPMLTKLLISNYSLPKNLPLLQHCCKCNVKEISLGFDLPCRRQSLAVGPYGLSES